MDLFEAHGQGLPLVVDTIDGGERLLAELFLHPQGLVFADVGWHEAVSHPFHLLRGRLVRKTHWRVGRHDIRIAFEGETLFENWRGWRAYLASPEGAEVTREKAFLLTQEVFPETQSACARRGVAAGALARLR